MELPDILFGYIPGWIEILVQAQKKHLLKPEWQEIGYWC
jgi:hypothetical protein